MAIATLLVFVALAAAAPDPETAPLTIRTLPDIETLDPAVMEARLRRTFDRMDFDRDGAVSGREVPLTSGGQVIDPRGAAQETPSASYWLQDTDLDRNGKVTWPEYRATFLPLVLMTIRPAG